LYPFLELTNAEKRVKNKGNIKDLQEAAVSFYLLLLIVC